jgi:hypothetical protein
VPDPRLWWRALRHSAPDTLALTPALTPAPTLALTLTGLCCLTLLAPAAGRAGPFDDPGWEAAAMVAWASAVDAFTPGPMDAAAPELGVAAFGLPELALGSATLDPYDVVSLGDGGWITLQFETSIIDGVGHDFAVFENGFYTVGGLYAELAYVEVSSNGLDFARLPAEALNPGAVSGLDPVDPTDYHNLAGRHPLAVGTGFDLADLAFDPLVTSGLLDLEDVRFVRLVDVVGDGSTMDAYGDAIHDPYPTAFAAGGFDLEAVGVIHTLPEPDLARGLTLGALVLSWTRKGRRSRTCGPTR